MKYLCAFVTQPKDSLDQKEFDAHVAHIRIMASAI